MSGFERVKDFVRWMREVQANLGGLDAPKEALSLVDGSPMLLQRRGSDYDVLRPAGPGDKSPIYLNINSVLTTTVKVSNEASLYGASAARIEAAKASPFPLEDGAFALAPNASAWKKKRWTAS